MAKPGADCEQAVDLMSLYPTLCELAGVPVPKHVGGREHQAAPGQPGRRRGPRRPSPPCIRSNHTLRTAEWRYIHYEDGTEELYNERTDPREWTNVAAKSEYADVKKKLAKYLPATNAAPVESNEAPPKRKRRRRTVRKPRPANKEAPSLPAGQGFQPERWLGRNAPGANPDGWQPVHVLDA